MVYTEIKQRGEKRYYYRTKSIRNKDKVDKKRIYLGVNLLKSRLKQLEKQADEKLNKKEAEKPVEKHAAEKKARKAREKVGDKSKKITFNISKQENFSKWFTEIVKTAELGDLRYNVKGFLVFQPWSVRCMEKMYKYIEQKLQEKKHEPYWFPTVIPEENFKKEQSHISGFQPEVFWLKEISGEGKLALRPTSETGFYQMFALWIRSYKDLPLKTYQRANVFRYETKATRPFLRSREFHWIEAHCAHATEEDAMKQVHEDMETTKQILHDIYGLPFIFFERPSWDKFPGAYRTFAADVLNPDGRVVQQPSTHLLKQDFARAFNVKFEDKDGKEKYCYITCYGPAISRIFASVITIHGDNRGLRFPWRIAPLQVIIIPIKQNPEILNTCKKIKNQLQEQNISCKIDDDEKRPGEKFYFWEMKGVPLRIEFGEKELKNKQLTIYRRDINERQIIDSSQLLEFIKKTSEDLDKNLIKQADNLFKNKIIDAENQKELQEIINAGKIARCGFCSVDKPGEKCAEAVEKKIRAFVRGTKLKKETPKSKTSRCVICNKKAKAVVYIARAY
jgi:prolyl-tRNA synthetase